jgi:ABC-type dipeptide/oligopeptide/nickel transport system permease component
MVSAIIDGDYPITQGLVALAALFYTASHVIADWLALMFDPRLREIA